MKKSTVAFILSMTDDRYANLVSEMIDNMDGGSRAHVAVAYQNLVPTLAAITMIQKDIGNDYGVKEFIYEMAAEQEKPLSEINERRAGWFLIAALLLRLEKLSDNDIILNEIGSIIWTIIATDYPRLKNIIPNNIVWKPEEKLWFDLSLPDLGLIDLCINIHMPKKFFEHAATKQFCKDMGILHMRFSSFR